jgi:ribonuclease HI
MAREIFTDGGCKGNPGPGGWAFVIIDTDNKGGTEAALAEQYGGEVYTTNNRMELMAVIKALVAWSVVEEGFNGQKRVKKPVTLYTDSQYVHQGISSWIKKWKMNGWRTADREPVKNQDLWMQLDALAAGLNIDWHWLKGHAGHHWNERCDALTQKAIFDIVNGNKRAS